MKYSYLIAFSLLMGLLSGCIKPKGDDSVDNCAEIQQVKIVADKDSVYLGDDIHLKVNKLPSSALFNWIHDNDNSYGEDLKIFFAEKSDEGWYHLHVSDPDCPSHDDSIFISVRNKPATAPCSPTNNTISFSSIPGLNPATVSWSFSSTWNRRVLSAHGALGYPDFNIYFNTYWDTREPEDGEYFITTMSATNDYPPYTVYISSLYSSIFFQAGTGKVYISHAGGKLRVTFCNVSLSGSLGGPSFTTTATGTLTAP